MEPADIFARGAPSSGFEDRDEPVVRLRLYVAQSTPNSVRAQSNLSAVLENLMVEGASPLLEIVDVFSQPKRALTEGVIVTPTLIGLSGSKRVVLMGDLADLNQLEGVLRGLLT